MYFGFSSCQGDPPLGNPKLCYFTFSATVTDSPCPHPSFNFRILFEDETGETFLFDNQVAPTRANQLLALPSGHTYKFWILNNGTVSDCVLGMVHVSVLAPNTAEICHTISAEIDERLEICCGTPDGTFFLPVVCNGCVTINP